MAAPETEWSPEQSRLFDTHDQTFRGHIRYEVTRHNLAATLDEFLRTPRRAIDVGGGKGLDAKWLSKVGAGHDVILFDQDDESRREAIRDNIRQIQILSGGSRDALDTYGVESFDLVLSHGVIQYQTEPKEELRKLAELIRLGGYLSLLAAGRLGKLNRYQKLDDKKMVDRLLLTGKFFNKLNVDSKAFLPRDIELILEGVGLEVVDWFGVRIFSDDDYRLTDAVPALHRNRILNEEIRASSDPKLRPQGQMLHYIARKRP